MSVYSSEYHAMVFSPLPSPSTAAAATETESTTVTASKSGNQDEGFFHHLLDVVNPLQHLPVVGTIYRAITGEHIGAVERIAGDTLYGGLWGAVSSVADVAFEGITGKSAEDTVLSWFRGGSSSQVAKITAPSITVAQSLPSSDTPSLPPLASTVASGQLTSPDIAALSASLTAKGVNGDMASRALDAYRRSMGPFTPQPVFASVH